MRINICFNEDYEDVDVIEIPFDDNIDVIQCQFYSWLFDKNNSHEYWVIENGEKKYCAYDTNAFVKWLNTVHLHNNVQARIVAQHVNNLNPMYDTLFF